MPLRTKISYAIEGTETRDDPFGVAMAPFVEAFNLTLDDGTGVNQANRMIMVSRTVASGATDDVDLAGAAGFQRPLGGGILTITEIVALAIVNAPPGGETVNTTALTIGGAGSASITNLFGGTAHTLILRPGAAWFMACGGAGGIATVTATTGDILRVVNASGAPATYQLAIIGRQ